MRILNTKLTEVNISNDESIKETFKDFLTGNDTNSLKIEDIKEVFNGENIKEVIIQKGIGTTFENAIFMIKNASVGYNPLNARKIVLMLSIKNEKISTLLRIMEKFKQQLKYEESFRWGFTINQSQEEDYIVNMAEADLIDDNATTSINLSIADETFNVNTKWLDVERMKQAAKLINSKIQSYEECLRGQESEKRILLMAMLDLTTSYNIEDSTKV